MSIFGPPNIQKLERKKDQNGLIKALSYSKDAHIRASAAKALAKLRSPMTTQSLCNALNDEEEEVRMAAAETLCAIQDIASIDALIKALDDPNAKVRYTALKALEFLNSPKRIIPLIKKLNDDDYLTGMFAAEVLGRINAQEAVAPIIKAMQARPNNSEPFIRALGALKNPAAVEPLIDMMQVALGKIDGKYHYVLRSLAAETLGDIGDPRAVMSLLDLVASANMDEKKAGLSALKKIGAKGIEIMLSALPQSSARIQGMISKLLLEHLRKGAHLSQKNIDDLLLYARSEDENTHVTAVEVLSELDEPRIIPTLVKALHDEKTVDLAQAGLLKFGKPIGPHLNQALPAAQGRTAFVMRQLMIQTGYLSFKRDEFERKEVGLFNAFDAYLADYAIHLASCQFAFRKFEDTKVWVMLNGKPTYKWDGVFGLTFSPEGRHFAYAARRDHEHFVLMDENMSHAWTNVAYNDPFNEPGKHLIALTDDGHIAYPVIHQGRWGVAKNHQVPAWFDGIMTDSICFSPDGKHMAYAAQKNGLWHLIQDNEPGKGYAMIGIGSIKFSPDSTKLAYIAMKDRRSERWCLVENSIEMDNFNTWEPPIYSPDSQHLAYGKGLHSGATWVLDGKPLGQYVGIVQESFRFSPDSQHYAFIVRYGTTYGNVNRLIRDGSAQGKEYDFADQPVFSPDSQHCAFAAQQGNSQFVILDGRELGQHQYIGESSLSFSPDSHILAYEGIDGSQRRVITNKTQGAVFDFIFTTNNGGIYFDTNESFHYLAQKDGSAYWLKEKVEWIEAS